MLTFLTYKILLNQSAVFWETALLFVCQGPGIFRAFSRTPSGAVHVFKNFTLLLEIKNLLYIISSCK